MGGPDESEADRNSEREEEVEGGESEEALVERCSLSQRKMTESDDEVIERCVRSEGGETDGEALEVDEESNAQMPQTAPESEDEAVEVFGAARGRSAEPDGETMLGDRKALDRKSETLAGEMENVTKKCPLPAEVGLGVFAL